MAGENNGVMLELAKKIDKNLVGFVMGLLALAPVIPFLDNNTIPVYMELLEYAGPALIIVACSGIAQAGFEVWDTKTCINCKPKKKKN